MPVTSDDFRALPGVDVGRTDDFIIPGAEGRIMTMTLLDYGIMLAGFDDFEDFDAEQILQIAAANSMRYPTTTSLTDPLRSLFAPKQ